MIVKVIFLPLLFDIALAFHANFFEIALESFFHGISNNLFQPKIQGSATFELITTTKPTPVQISPENSTAYLNSSFLAGAPTKILIHGWRGSKNSTMEVIIAEAYINTSQVNVVKVDWSEQASDLYYFPSALSLDSVGMRVAAMIDRIIEAGSATLDTVHVIGFSLGAYAAGIAGSRVKSGKIARITGLDPAFPGFGLVPTIGRLGRTDAQFVDVIHTCAGVFGNPIPVGHVDFYPNGGLPPAPGCFIPLDVNATLICSHKRSFEYFAESVYQPNTFLSVQCLSYGHYLFGLCQNNPTTYMGEGASPRARGKFYLRTNNKPPYAQV